MNKKYSLIVITATALTTQSAYVKKGREECQHCIDCYDKAWSDGFDLGEAVGESRERYRIIRNLINKRFTDKEIVELANTSYVEIEDVKRKMRDCFGHFEWEKGYEFCSEEEFWKKKKGDENG